MIKRENGENGIYQLMVDAGRSLTVKEAKKDLGLCKTGHDTPKKASKWLRMFNGWRGLGLSHAQAAELANEGKEVK